MSSLPTAVGKPTETQLQNALQIYQGSSLMFFDQDMKSGMHAMRDVISGQLIHAECPFIQLENNYRKDLVKLTRVIRGRLTDNLEDYFPDETIMDLVRVTWDKSEADLSDTTAIITASKRAEVTPFRELSNTDRVYFALMQTFMLDKTLQESIAQRDEAIVINGGTADEPIKSDEGESEDEDEDEDEDDKLMRVIPNYVFVQFEGTNEIVNKISNVLYLMYGLHYAVAYNSETHEITRGVYDGFNPRPLYMYRVMNHVDIHVLDSKDGVRKHPEKIHPFMRNAYFTFFNRNLYLPAIQDIAKGDPIIACYSPIETTAQKKAETSEYLEEYKQMQKSAKGGKSRKR